MAEKEVTKGSPGFHKGKKAAARDPENLLVRIFFQDGKAQLSAATVN